MHDPAPGTDPGPGGPGRASKRRLLSDTTAAVHVRIPPGCCTGWYFEHTADCHDPATPRACSDCSADPGAEHNPHTCSWYWSDDNTDFDDDLSPDAARWPGRPVGDDQF